MPEMHIHHCTHPPSNLCSPHACSHQDGWTPLHMACMRGHAEVVRLLLDAGSKADDTAGDVSVLQV